MKAATLFSGFDGVGVGMKAAGIEHAWGIEWRDDVANVARLNGFHTITADILTVDPRNMEPVDILHASPPCTNASVANAKAGETDLDRALGAKVEQFIEAINPKIFTLENVWQYRNFDAYKRILATLERFGYWIDSQHVNAADFGVPQTRRRMFLRARRGWLPHLPEPVRWVGWYEAIEDLIPTLPDSQFAPWQVSRFPKECETILMHSSDMRSMPSFRAILVNTSEMHGNEGAAYTTIDAGDPMYTVSSTSEPSRNKAFLVVGSNSTKDDVTRSQDEPAWTVGDVNRPGNIPRAYSNGRVVSMTPRALARFQSFPDWYELPAKKALACYGIGNAVPPLMVQRIYEGLTGGAGE